jgi:hypothetical protein
MCGVSDDEDAVSLRDEIDVMEGGVNDTEVELVVENARG